MRIGLDLHGTIDSDPKFWSKFSQLFVANEHEIHIISGPPEKIIVPKLVRFRIAFSYVFSIVDYHRQRGTKMWQDRQGRWNMSPREWDKTKGDYCLKNTIDLMIDDSLIYGKFFITPYAHYSNRSRLNQKSNRNTKEKR